MENINNLQEIIKKITLEVISSGKHKKINIMEVCGTHTMAIAKYGISQLLPPAINLISGPGCPVCVTPTSDIDWIIEIIKNHEVVVFTFGDMVRVPGTISSLYIERMYGADIRICYSPMDSIIFAERNPDKNILFIAIGFETTIPITSVVLKKAQEKKLDNFFVFSTHKIIPPALDALLQDEMVRVKGLLLPGHVSAIIGSHPYEFISAKYGIPGVISGFGPGDILISITRILEQVKNGSPHIENTYTGVVKAEGNPHAFSLISEVFNVEDSIWRGLGTIPRSGLEINERFAGFDAKIKFPVKKIKSLEPSGCACGDILKGLKKPTDCKLFSRKCRPDSPVGPCMVSTEGDLCSIF